MADKFDPYREALVMETVTIWPEEYHDIDQPQRDRIAVYLHEHPDQASELEYFRTHTGFCRKITVTESDLQRAKR